MNVTLQAVRGAAIVKALEVMRKEKCRFRVLGLSATPGSSAERIQAGPRTRTLSRVSKLYPI